jgi:predicted glycosyltransferase
LTARVLLYCHNVLGFGHIVRSMRIAEELVAAGAECRLITGCRFLDKLHVPSAVEVVRLPALRAEADGRLTPLDGTFLGTAIRRRSRMIAEEIRTWQPHVTLVDHNPLGLMGELTEAIDDTSQTRFIWGIRDIWSASDHFKSMIRFAGGEEPIKRRILRYHSAIAYTDAAWIETLDKYRGFALPERTASVGFVTAPVVSSEAAPGPPLIAVLSGGGEGAERLTRLVLAATDDLLAEGKIQIRFVVGPFASSDDVAQQTGARQCIEVWPEGSVEDAIRGASLIVCRVGYNTAYSVVQSDLPIILTPLMGGNEEQAMRAARLAELPGIETIDDREPDAPQSLAAAIERGLAAGRRKRVLPFSTNGAQRAAQWILDAASETNA